MILASIQQTDCHYKEAFYLLLYLQPERFHHETMKAILTEKSKYTSKTEHKPLSSMYIRKWNVTGKHEVV